MSADPPIRFSVPTPLGPEPDAAAAAIAQGHVGARGPHTQQFVWLLLPPPERRYSLTAWMPAAGVTAPLRYPSLAHTPAGRRYGRTDGTPVSDSVAGRLVRLPLHHALSETDLDRVIDRAITWRPTDEEQ